MSGIFALYFRKNFPWTMLSMGVLLLLTPLLGRLPSLASTETLWALWYVLVVPSACLVNGATAGTDTGAEGNLAAELPLPVSGFARLAGAALASLAIAAVLVAALLGLALFSGEKSVVQAGGGFMAATYALALLLGCLLAFVFGRLSGSIFGGVAAGGALAALTLLGIGTSMGVDAMTAYGNGLSWAKLAALPLAGGCALLALRYVSALTDRKARPGLRNAGAAALLLAAGPLLAGGMMAVSKLRAERLLVPGFAGDLIPLAGYVVEPPVIPSGYSLLQNPVTEEVFLLGPDASLTNVLGGGSKSYLEFLKNPMTYLVHSYSIGGNGEVWALLRRNGLKLFHAAPGGRLEQQLELPSIGIRASTLFRSGGRTFLLMKGVPDTIHYLAEVTPGMKKLDLKVIGTDSASAQRAVLALRESTGELARLGADRTRLLVSRAGRETEVCRLPYKATPGRGVYRPLETGGRRLFFVPVVKDGRNALYYCESGKPARQAWDASAAELSANFFRNADGSAYGSLAQKEQGKYQPATFYIVNDAGELLPPVDLRRFNVPGTDLAKAYLARAAGRELYFVAGDSALVRLTPDGAAEKVAAWRAPVMTWRTVKDGIVYVNHDGAHLVTWKGENRRLR